MTTTITPGGLTVTLTETLTLADGSASDHGVTSTNSFTIDGVTNVTKRVVSVSTVETGLLSFAADLLTAVWPPAFTAYAAGHYDSNLVRYIRIANKDDSDNVILTFRNQGEVEFAVILEFGQSHSYSCDASLGVAYTMAAGAVGVEWSLADLADVTVRSVAGPVDLEVFVASI